MWSRTSSGSAPPWYFAEPLRSHRGVRVSFSIDPSGRWTLGDILPDWSEPDVGRLLRRAAFDPATFGRCRLHNDNDGEVSSYLAARWLGRLLAANCPPAAVRDLLFANVHGELLVRPSARSTAAWLARRDADVSRELLSRDPGALIDEGDPDSLSPAQRAAVLTALIDHGLRPGGTWTLHIHERFRQFASADLSETVRHEWHRCREAPSGRALLLQVVWSGRLSSCIDLVRESISDARLDAIGRVFAIRAFVELADSRELADFTSDVVNVRGMLPAMALWEAAENLFPDHLSAEGLLQLVGPRARRRKSLVCPPRGKHGRQARETA